MHGATSTHLTIIHEFPCDFPNRSSKSFFVFFSRDRYTNLILPERSITFFYIFLPAIPWSLVFFVCNLIYSVPIIDSATSISQGEPHIREVLYIICFRKTEMKKILSVLTLYVYVSGNKCNVSGWYGRLRLNSFDHFVYNVIIYSKYEL